MSGRDIHEHHRVSTPLELLFDLFFVVAIAAAASQLHHAVVENHLGSGFVGFLRAFFAIWWAWMTFTWFASAYDTDDVPYRIGTMVQMVGVLIIAAGIPKGASEGDFTISTIGYVVMRVAYVALWLRAAREHPERRVTALRYAWGTFFVQVLWVARLWAPPGWELPTWLLLAMFELAVPLYAAKAGRAPWHAHHIAERYGLFTIIVLGECVLGATNSVAGVISAQGFSADVLLVGLGCASLVLSLWWVYFLVPSGERLHVHRDRAFRWGYGHVVIFTSIAALGAFLEVVADQLKAAPAGAAHAAATAAQAGGSHAAGAAHAVTPTLAIGLAAAAVAVYLVSTWWLFRLIAPEHSRHWKSGLLALAILAGVVLAVSAGLPLPWALPLLTLAPVAVVVAIERDGLGC